MRVAVTGASGNVGTSLLRALADDASIEEIVGVARRVPTWQNPRTRWVKADVSRDPLEPVFAGADAVVHLAWLIQPSRDLATLEATNVEGSRRVFGAAAAAGVGALVHASSIGAYSLGPKDRPVDESYPTDGVPTSFYSRHKAACERMLDTIEREHPLMRVVRLRPGLIFKREAASGIRRLFAGPFLPSPLVRRGLIPIVPSLDRLVFQGVHSFDVGEAYRRAVTSDVRGVQHRSRPGPRPTRARAPARREADPRARTRAQERRRSLVETAPSAHASGLAGPCPRRPPDGHHARGARPAMAPDAQRRRRAAGADRRDAPRRRTADRSAAARRRRTAASSRVPQRDRRSLTQLARNSEPRAQPRRRRSRRRRLGTSP